MVFEFIDPKHPKWRQVLATVSYDFYHLPEYVTLAANYEGVTPAAFLGEINNEYCLIPLLIRPIPPQNNLVDAISPYGYSSPIISKGMNNRNLDVCLKEFCEQANQLGIVSVFLRLHPLLPLDLDVLNRYGQTQLHGCTVYIDLNFGFEKLSREIRKGHREDIRKLQTQSFTVEINNWSHLESFAEAYKSTMERVKASQFYMFSMSYFEQLLLSLANKMHLFSVLSPQGEFAAGGLFAECNGLVQYHLSGSNAEFSKFAPSKLMLYEVIKWAEARGNRYLHLGGGHGAKEDGLYEFKRGFSDKKADFYTHRMIINPLLYQQLCEDWRQNTGNRLPTTDFFPLYRHPH